jgi:hypothetical protein
VADVADIVKALFQLDRIWIDLEVDEQCSTLQVRLDAGEVLEPLIREAVLAHVFWMSSPVNAHVIVIPGACAHLIPQVFDTDDVLPVVFLLRSATPRGLVRPVAGKIRRTRDSAAITLTRRNLPGVSSLS